MGQNRTRAKPAPSFSTLPSWSCHHQQRPELLKKLVLLFSPCVISYITHNLWTSVVRLLCMCGLDGLLWRSSENVMLLAPLKKNKEKERRVQCSYKPVWFADMLLRMKLAGALIVCAGLRHFWVHNHTQGPSNVCGPWSSSPLFQQSYGFLFYLRVGSFPIIQIQERSLWLTHVQISKKKYLPPEWKLKDLLIYYKLKTKVTMKIPK